MDDLGQPSSYLALEAGVAVYTSDGAHVGDVAHVLADEDEDIFDGLVLRQGAVGGGHRFVDAEQVEEIYERGVLLKVDREGVEGLPEPSANPAAMDTDPADGEESGMTRKLRRAWDLISGNY